MNSAQRTYLNVQALRGISAVAVLFFHLALREVQDWPDAQGHLFHPFYFFGTAGVDLFFVISGFVIASASLGDFGRPDRILGFLKKRFYRIYPIYWVTCLPILAWSIVHHGTNWFGSLASMMLVPGYSNVVNPVSWSLVHEVLFYAIFALVMFAPLRLLPIFLSVWAIAIMAYYFEPGQLSPLWIYGPVLFSLRNFAFMFGVAIALVARSKNLLFPRFAMVAGGAMLACGAALNALGVAEVHDWPNRLIFLEVPAACIIYGAVGIELQGTVWSSRILQILGDASYSIYLVHFMVVLAAKPFYPAIQGVVLRMAWTLSVCALALTAGLLTYYYLERPMLRLFRERTSPRRKIEFEAAPEPAAPGSLVGV